MIDGDSTDLGLARHLSAADILLDLAASLPADDPDRLDLVQDAIALLVTESASARAWALRGDAAWLIGDVQQAIGDWRRALDLGAVQVLQRLIEALQRAGEVEEAATCAVQLRTRADDPEIVWARVEAAEREGGPEPAWVEEAVQRAAVAGHPAARRRMAFDAISRGELAGLGELRRQAELDPHAAWALGHYLWPFRLFGYLTGTEDEPVEAHHLLRRAHDQGELLATATLWLRSDAPQETEYEAVLQQCRITAWRREALVRMIEGEAVLGFLADRARRCRDADDSLTAVRLLQAAAVSGDDRAVDELGRLLLDEADDGPWAAFALFLQRWPMQLGPFVVGSPSTPLLARQRPAPLRDDHTRSVPIEGNDLARRILQALEQVGWRMLPVGDHLLVGSWEQAAAPVVVLLELPGPGNGQWASISTALLAGLPDDLPAPWALPPSRFTVDADTDLDVHHEVAGELDLSALREAVGDRMRAHITAVDAEDTDYWGMQRRCLEALFRVGEFEAAPQSLSEVLAVRVQLSALEGRRLTFAGLPPGLVPRPWTSVATSDYLASPGIVDHPAAHRLARPLAVRYVGYDLDGRLSGGHLLTALLSAVESLKAISGCVTGMFDRDRGIFEEFFHAVPMTRLLHCRDLLQDHLPEQAWSQRGRLDLIAEYNAAWALLAGGQREAAHRAFERAARGGQPHALSTVIWSQLLTGDLHRARAAWEAHSAKVPGWIGESGLQQRVQDQMWEQWPNCQVNAGLAFAATGDLQTAGRLWQEAAAAGNGEARACAAVQAWRQGNHTRAAAMLGQLSVGDREQVRMAMQEVREGAVGWFQDWATDCLRLLDARLERGTVAFRLASTNAEDVCGSEPT